MANTSNLNQMNSSRSTNKAEHNEQTKGKSHVLNQETDLLLACSNARSLKYKVAAVTDYIINENMDICVFMETWLKDRDTASIVGLLPAGYEFRNFPHLSGRYGGGIGIMFKDTLNDKMSDSNEKQCLEFSEWTVHVHYWHLVFLLL